jgi:CelD/BcsL family acetyltransferase involved in cellulose biosynthesis
VTLRVERIADVAELESLIPEWEEIDAQSEPRTPFTSPLWNVLWWRHFNEQRTWVRDEFFVHVVRDECGGLVAVAPLMRTLRPARGPLRIRQLHFFGADPNVTELRGVVCRPEHRGKVTRMLLAHFLKHAGQWDRLQWCGLRASESLEGRGMPVWYRQVPDYYLRLPATWQEFKSGLSRNVKEALRKCYNSLKRGGHEFTFRAVSRPQDIGAALDGFFELHAARARVNGSVPHANVFATARSREFLAEYAQRMAERDQFRVFQLEVDGRVVATRIGFVLGEEVYLYYSGYCPEWGKYSVMTTVVAESIKWALERQFKVVNLSTGNDLSKARWKPAETVFFDCMLRSPRLFGRLVSGDYLDKLRHAPPQSLLGRLVAGTRRNAFTDRRGVFGSGPDD